MYDMAEYSTSQAAKKLGISWPTLNKFIALKRIPIPPITRVGRIRVRLWADGDIQRVREILPKIANGRKTRQKKKRLTVGRPQTAKTKKKTPPRAAAPEKPKKKTSKKKKTK
jgi:hypothetical protein